MPPMPLWNLDVLPAIQTSIRAGALVAAVRRSIDAMMAGGHQATHLVMNTLEWELHERRAWSPAELTLALRLASDSGLATLSTLLGQLLPVTVQPEAGKAFILTAGSQQLQDVGVVLPLRVTTTWWGGGFELCPRQYTATDAIAAFRHGAMAAGNALLGAFGAATLTRHVIVNNCRVRGDFDGLRYPVDGESLGLGAAIATLSSYTNWCVPVDAGFTGRIGHDGTIYSVGEIATKLRGAADKGLRCIYLPAANDGAEHRQLASDLGLTLRWVESLADVVRDLGLTDDMREAVRALDATALAPEATRRYWMTESRPGEARRVLFSAIGKSDPIGTMKDRSGVPIGTDDGPLLTLCRELSPSVVHCLYTVAPKDNDYRDKYTNLDAILSGEESATRIVPHGLDDVLDPTDLESLLPAFARVVDQVLAEEDHPNVEFYANVTSGTGQMLITWHLLQERLALRGFELHLLQVREARWRRSATEPLVRRVVLPGSR